jgi:hypothetical protein
MKICECFDELLLVFDGQLKKIYETWSPAKHSSEDALEWCRECNDCIITIYFIREWHREHGSRVECLHWNELLSRLEKCLKNTLTEESGYVSLQIVLLCDCSN